MRDLEKNTNINSDGIVEWGFTTPTAGNYSVVFGDLEDPKLNDSGKTSLRLPTVISGGEFDGAFLSIFIPVRDADGNVVEFGEKKLNDVLICSNLAAGFEKRFPDNDHFDDVVMKALQKRLPGNLVDVEISISKDGKYTNVDKIAKHGALTNETVGKKTEQKSTIATESQDEDWNDGQLK